MMYFQYLGNLWCKQLGFYWKYSRNGWKSKTYKSFIIDVLPSSWMIDRGRKIWNTSFEELEAFLILLQDIEVINNPGLGPTKPAFDIFVRELGYKATKEYQISGNAYIVGKAVIGRHLGSPLPWGFFSDKTTPMVIDVTDLKYDYVVPVNSIKGNDMLQHYVKHPSFENNGEYWDYMPMHSCLINIVSEMKKTDITRTEIFLKNILKWI